MSACTGIETIDNDSRQQHETIAIQRLFQASCPLYVDLTALHGLVDLVPGVHPVSTGLLGGIAGGVGGLQQGSGGIPTLVKRYQSNIGTNPKTLLITNL